MVRMDPRAEEMKALEAGEMRRAFGGVAEISTLQSNTYVVAPAAELSPHECFVRTSAILLTVGTQVRLKITFDGSEFNAAGEVAYTLAEKGVGITLWVNSADDLAVLKEWVNQTSV